MSSRLDRFLPLVLVLLILVSGCTAQSPDINKTQTGNQQDPSKNPNQWKPPQVLGKNLEGQGYAELVGAADGIATWLSKKRITRVISLDDPSKPSLSGIVDMPGFSETVFANEKYLFVGGSEGLRIFPVDNPLGKPLSSINLESRPMSIDVVGDYAYIAGDSLMILDISDPSKPVQLGAVAIKGAGPSETQVREGYAYVVVGIGGLNIIDVRDPKNPKKIGGLIPLDSHRQGFRIIGKYAYLTYIDSIKGSTEPGVYGWDAISPFLIYDLTDPEKPRRVGSVELKTSIKNMEISGNYAYVTGSTGSLLTVIDISSPANPQIKNIIKSMPFGSELQDIFIYNKKLYIADSGNGILIFNLEDPEKPVYLDSLEFKEMNIKMHGTPNAIFVATQQMFFNIADVSDPENPLLTYSKNVPSGSYPYTNMKVKDGRSHFNSNSFQVYDLKDLKNPKKIDAGNMAVDSFDIIGNNLFSLIGEWGLDVYDIFDITKSRALSRTPFPIGVPHGFGMDEKWLVGVANGPFSIGVIDVTDPQIPAAGGSYEFDYYGFAAAVSNNHAFVAQGPNGLDILKINPNGSFKFLTNYKAEGQVHDVLPLGNKLYALKGGSGIDELDITDPSTPKLLRTFYSRGEASDAVIEGNYMYLADGRAGLTVISLEN